MSLNQDGWGDGETAQILQVLQVKSPTCHPSAAICPELHECFHTVDRLLNAKGQSKSYLCNSKQEKTLRGYK